MSASQDSRKTSPDELPPDHHYVVISSDSHAGADLLDYKPYLESKWHGEFDAWAASYSNPWDFVDPRLEKPGFDFGETEVLTGAASWHSALSWDSPRRLLHMDEDGVSAEVVFPNTAQPFLSGSAFAGTGPANRADYERRQAGLRAHNRWLVDFCAQAPDRRAGIAQVMLQDVDDAVREVRDMLGGTAGRVFGFDMGRLQQVADRVGPTVQDVRTPPAKLPSVPDESMSPVFL
jgi:predicted TIM-barrel fold metal-dependent hydrolase